MYVRTDIGTKIHIITPSSSIVVTAKKELYSLLACVRGALYLGSFRYDMCVCAHSNSEGCVNATCVEIFLQVYRFRIDTIRFEFSDEKSKI